MHPTVETPDTATSDALLNQDPPSFQLPCKNPDLLPLQALRIVVSTMSGFSNRGMLRVSEDENNRREGYRANYKQIRDSLIDLQQSANRIFDTISLRTAKENEKLIGLSKRIQSAKAKIEAISHRKEPITIRSPSKYPSRANGEEDFQTLFGYRDDENGGNVPVGKILVNGGLNREFGADGTLELFQFFSGSTPDLPLREFHPMVGSRAGCSGGNTSVDNLLKPPHLTYGSLLKEDYIARDSSSSSKQQSDLPPPPPSLLHGSQVPQRSEDFNRTPSATYYFKLQNSLSNMALSGSPSLPSVAKTTLTQNHQQSRDSEIIAASIDVQNPVRTSHDENSPREGERNDPEN